MTGPLVSLLVLAAVVGGLVAVLVVPHASAIRGCRAAGGHWRLVASTCDFGGAR